MKKNKEREKEQKGEPRRLTLNRETIQVLNNPALLGVAGGGIWTWLCGCSGSWDGCPTNTEDPS